MECDSCSEDKIKYINNCYIIQDQNIKSFYNPAKSNSITSCFELNSLFIKEDKNECIDNIESGYFLSDSTTGLLSKCHQNCSSCSKKYTEDNENCDTCKNGF